MQSDNEIIPDKIYILIHGTSYEDCQYIIKCFKDLVPAETAFEEYLKQNQDYKDIPEKRNNYRRRLAEQIPGDNYIFLIEEDLY